MRHVSLEMIQARLLGDHQSFLWHKGEFTFCKWQPQGEQKDRSDRIHIHIDINIHDYKPLSVKRSSPPSPFSETRLQDRPLSPKRLACLHASIPVVDTCYLEIIMVTILGMMKTTYLSLLE